MTTTTCSTGTLRDSCRWGVRRMSAKRQKYEAKRQQKEMAEIFDSYEYMLRDLIERLDYKLARIDYEAACFGVALDTRREYVRGRLIKMIGETADKMEGKRNAL